MKTVLHLKNVQKHYTILILLPVDCSSVNGMLKIDLMAAKDHSFIIINIDKMLEKALHRRHTTLATINV